MLCLSKLNFLSTAVRPTGGEKKNIFFIFFWKKHLFFFWEEIFSLFFWKYSGNILRAENFDETFFYCKKIRWMY